MGNVRTEEAIMIPRCQPGLSKEKNGTCHQLIWGRLTEKLKEGQELHFTYIKCMNKILLNFTKLPFK